MVTGLAVNVQIIQVVVTTAGFVPNVRDCLMRALTELLGDSPTAWRVAVDDQVGGAWPVDEEQPRTMASDPPIRPDDPLPYAGVDIS